MRRTASRLLHSRLLSSGADAAGIAPLLERLHLAPRGASAEVQALRALWQHLRAPPAEPPCSACDCGEPCGEPIADWSFSGAASSAELASARTALVAARDAHASFFDADADTAALLPSGASAASEAPGESLPFQSTAAALLRARLAYPRDAQTQRPLALADLAAGAGRPALAAALLGGFAPVHGREASPALHAASLRATQRYAAWHAAAAAAVPRLVGAAPTAPADVALLAAGAGDKASWWSLADVVLALGLPDSAAAQQAASGAALLRPGALLLSLGARLPASCLQVTERRRVRAAWGMATLVVHRRLADDMAGRAHAGGMPGAHDDSGALVALREAGGMQRLASALHAGGASGAEAAVAAAFAARSELCARALCVAEAPAALAAALATPGAAAPPHARAAAALALAALAAHPPAAASLVAARAHEALVRVAADESSPDALRAAAASAIADVASAGRAQAQAVLAAGAAAPLRALQGSGHANAATAARAALVALGLEAPPMREQD
jgi:hypothetical protein